MNYEWIRFPSISLSIQVRLEKTNGQSSYITDISQLYRLTLKR
jgi:hypothetical protein